MKHLQLIALSLVLLMLFSCQSTPSEQSDTTSAEITSAEVEKEKSPYVEKTDYEGAPFHIISATEAGSSGVVANSLLFADEENGDLLNDSVYRRFCETEEYLNITITYDNTPTETEFAPIIERSVMAGDDSYQLVLANNMRGNSEMIVGGMLYDWNAIEQVDFSHEYWNQRITESLEINNQVFLAKSSYTMPVHHVVTFNKEMAESYKFEDFYELVRSGGWTMGKMFEFGREVTNDANGDGSMDVNDTYGICAMCDIPFNSFFYASGQRLTQIGADNRLELCINNERTVSLYELLYRYFVADNIAYTYTWGDRNNPEKVIRMDSGRILFSLELTTALNEYRGYEIEYGILPYPKFDEEQEDYYIDDYGKYMAIPQTVGNPEMVGAAAEMLGYYTDLYVLDAYYEGLINNKVCRDEESIEMLKIAREGLVYDAGETIFGLNNKAMTAFNYYPSRTIISKKSNDFASFYKENEQLAKSEITDFYDAVAANLN